MCSTHQADSSLSLVAQPAAGRGRAEQHQVGAIQPEQVGRRGVPEVFADQHARPGPSACRRRGSSRPRQRSGPRRTGHRSAGRPCGARAAICALRQVGRPNEEPVARVLVHEAHHQVQLARGLQQRPEDRVVRRGACAPRGHQVLQRVAGERELGKHQQLHALRRRPARCSPGGGRGWPARRPAWS